MAQGLDDANKDPGDFKMLTLKARIKALEDANEELQDPDADEMPDPIIPFFGSEEGDNQLPMAFDVSLSGDVVTVSKGRYTEHGGAYDDIAGDDITLTGGPVEYVSVRWNRSTKQGDIVHSATRPLSAGNEVFVTLATYDQVGTGEYTLDAVNHRGDINFDLPLM